MFVVPFVPLGWVEYLRRWTKMVQLCMKLLSGISLGEEHSLCASPQMTTTTVSIDTQPHKSSGLREIVMECLYGTRVLAYLLMRTYETE